MIILLVETEWSSLLFFSPREVGVAVSFADCACVDLLLSSFRSLRSVLSHNDAEGRQSNGHSLTVDPGIQFIDLSSSSVSWSFIDCCP